MGRRVLLGVLFGVVVYAGILFWVDLDDFRAALSGFSPALVLAACGLSLANYLIRFAKWQRYLKLLAIELRPRTSLLIYLAGFSMGVTPGKMGEVFKSWMIRRVTGTPIHKSAPIIVAERVTDLLGYLILIAAGGFATVPEYQWVFWVVLAICAIGIALAGSHRFSELIAGVAARTPYVWRYKDKLRGSFQSTRVLLSPREIWWPTAISVVSWGCECTGFWLIANGLTDAPFPYLYAVFAYAFSAVVGAVAIIFPGGLLITEGSLGTLTRRKIMELTQATIEDARSLAAGATLLARLCTLWFGVALGVLATMIFERRYGHIDMESDE
jgi:uncharacterized protein (TIRG00374 family)